MMFIKDNKAGIVYKFFGTIKKDFWNQKKGFGTIATSIEGASLNEELAQELPKPVFKIFKRRKIFARFKDNIWAADLAEIKPFSPFNLIAKYLLCLLENTKALFHSFIFQILTLAK